MTTPVPVLREHHLLAERYKTKVCRNFVSLGCCPYETRCMFAHGEEELRNAEMNLCDGLITEEAIKSFQRILSLRSRQKLIETPSRSVSPRVPDYDASLSNLNHFQPLRNLASRSPDKLFTASCNCNECQYYYQHNPYSYDPPQYYFDTCKCAECVGMMPLPDDAVLPCSCSQCTPFSVQSKSFASPKVFDTVVAP